MSFSHKGPPDISMWGFNVSMWGFKDYLDVLIYGAIDFCSSYYFSCNSMNIDQFLVLFLKFPIFFVGEYIQPNDEQMAQTNRHSSIYSPGRGYVSVRLLYHALSRGSNIDNFDRHPYTYLRSKLAKSLTITLRVLIATTITIYDQNSRSC